MFEMFRSFKLNNQAVPGKPDAEEKGGAIDHYETGMELARRQQFPAALPSQLRLTGKR
jgi:hypothetical protein